MTSAILLAMLAQPPYYADRHDPPESRRQLYTPIAEAIGSAARGDRDVVSALLSHSWHETKWGRLIVTGQCRRMPKGQRCDEGRARTVFQVHGWCRGAFASPDGSRASLEAGARCAASMLRAGRARCRSWLGAFAGMRGSFACTSPAAPARVATMRRVAALLDGSRPST
jgi:hypothetical protein